MVRVRARHVKREHHILDRPVAHETIERNRVAAGGTRRPLDQVGAVAALTERVALRAAARGHPQHEGADAAGEVLVAARVDQLGVDHWLAVRESGVAAAAGRAARSYSRSMLCFGGGKFKCFCVAPSSRRSKDTEGRCRPTGAFVIVVVVVPPYTLPRCRALGRLSIARWLLVDLNFPLVVNFQLSVGSRGQGQGGAGQKKGGAGQGGGRQKRKELVEDTVAAHKREQQQQLRAAETVESQKRSIDAPASHIRAHGWPTA